MYLRNRLRLELTHVQDALTPALAGSEVDREHFFDDVDSAHGDHDEPPPDHPPQRTYGATVSQWVVERVMTGDGRRVVEVSRRKASLKAGATFCPGMPVSWREDGPTLTLHDPRMEALEDLLLMGFDMAEFLMPEFRRPGDYAMASLWVAGELWAETPVPAPAGCDADALSRYLCCLLV